MLGVKERYLTIHDLVHDWQIIRGYLDAYMYFWIVEIYGYKFINHTVSRLNNKD